MIRLCTLRRAADTEDPLWDNVDAALWSYLELITATLAASLPTLGPLVVKGVARVSRTSISQADGRRSHRGYRAQENSEGHPSQNFRRPILERSESMKSLYQSDATAIALQDITKPTPVAYEIELGSKSN